jgi:hypothetical protein
VYSECLHWRANQSIRDCSLRGEWLAPAFWVGATSSHWRGCGTSSLTTARKSGASGDIRTLKHLFLRQAAIPIRTRWHAWCTGEDLNLRVPLGETGLQPVCFSRAHAPVLTWRKIDESNAHRSSRCPVFRTNCRPFSSTFRMAESTGVEPVSLSCERPCLADKCLTVRPTPRRIVKEQRNSGRPGGI